MIYAYAYEYVNQHDYEDLYSYAYDCSSLVSLHPATPTPRPVRAMAAQNVSEVNSRTAFCSPWMPQLGLECKLEFEYRVYVIECETPPGARGPTVYVGIEHRSQINRRLLQHWGGTGAFFTKERKPKKLLLVWPAANTAVEGFVFLALLARLPLGSLGRIGGWSQTSTAVSPLSSMVFEQQRRLMRGLCFNCGGNHWAKTCAKELEGIKYKCCHCEGANTITSRGQALVAARGAHGVAPPPPRPLPPRPEPAARAAPKRQATPSRVAPDPQAKRAKHAHASDDTSRIGCLVSVCGKNYSTLSWYVGQSNPSPGVCKRVREECSANALELDGGDARTLWLQGFCGRPPKKALMPDRERLPSDFKETACTALRGGKPMKLRKAGGELEKQNRQILWLEADLVSMFRYRR